MPHLLVAITAHGFGHTAQIAPVVSALRRRIPDMQLTLQTTVPRHILDSRFEGSYQLIQESQDIGMIMTDALAVDPEASARAYAAFHHGWEHKVSHAAKTLEALAPDLVLANVPYLPIAAADEIGIPAVGACSLNWANIYRHYCGYKENAKTIHAQILNAYNRATCFLQTEPAMPMPELGNTRRIGPIASTGKNRRADINEKLGLRPGQKLVLASLGGIPTQINIQAWPLRPDIHWLVPKSWQIPRPDISAWEDLHLPFMDIAVSCDALLTKPGYGSFTEAVCNGIPVLYVPRIDWPEEPYLIEWLKRHGCCAEISQAQLNGGEMNDKLDYLFALPASAPIPPLGIMDAADVLEPLLRRP